MSRYAVLGTSAGAAVTPAESTGDRPGGRPMTSAVSKHATTEGAGGGRGILGDIEKAQSEVLAARSAWSQRIRRRDELVVDAIDVQHYSWRQVAKALGMPPGAVHRILVNFDRGEGAA